MCRGAAAVRKAAADLGVIKSKKPLQGEMSAAAPSFLLPSVIVLQ